MRCPFGVEGCKGEHNEAMPCRVDSEAVGVARDVPTERPAVSLSQWMTRHAVRPFTGSLMTEHKWSEAPSSDAAPAPTRSLPPIPVNAESAHMAERITAAEIAKVPSLGRIVSMTVEREGAVRPFSRVAFAQTAAATGDRSPVMSCYIVKVECER